MTAAAVMTELRAKGKPSTAAIYRRHGVREPSYGVPYAELGKLVKRIGRDHRLALGLWSTGVHDARVLATMIAAPESLSPTVITRWLRQGSNYVINDALSGLAATLPSAAALATKWTAAAGEWLPAAGWNVYAILATDGRLPATVARRLLERIRKEIGTAKNRTRHSMNNALIAMGGALGGAVRTHAERVVAAIGKVVVDHGETGCRTPDARAYMARMSAHTSRRKRVTGARTTSST